MFVATALAGRTVARWLERTRIALSPPSIQLQLEGSVDLERRDVAGVGGAGGADPLCGAGLVDAEALGEDRCREPAGEGRRPRFARIVRWRTSAR
jgi:hypothetical protein